MNNRDRKQLIFIWALVVIAALAVWIIYRNWASPKVEAAPAPAGYPIVITQENKTWYTKAFQHIGGGNCVSFTSSDNRQIMACGTFVVETKK